MAAVTIGKYACLFDHLEPDPPLQASPPLSKNTVPQPAPPDSRDVPLSRSLGFRMRRLFSDPHDEKHLSKEYLELYQEMIKASQESLENFDAEEEDHLEKIVGKEKLEIMKQSLKHRRRSVSRVASPFGKRRVRSQATRREKLNSQSLRSHQHHIRQADRDRYLRPEYDTAEVE